MFQALPLPSVRTSTSSLPEEEKVKPITDLNKGDEILLYIFNTLYNSLFNTLVLSLIRL